ncbi:MAG TPA: hypothetical protein VK184_17450 [Nostocaceae cyanobacterium]|nr:hypothetical protein [Nostocaceae cyanobacterium]
MGWFPQKTSNNELGEYLPDAETQPDEESEPIKARGQKEAEKKFEEIAQEYGGTDAKAYPTDKKGYYDCRFKPWG